MANRTTTRRATGVIGAAAAVLLSLPGIAGASSFTVSTNSDSGDGTCTPGSCTLREAIVAANDNADEDTIVFAPSVTGQIDLGSTLQTIFRPVRILGPGPNQLEVRRAPAAATEFGIFTAAAGSAPVPVTIAGLKISGGVTTSGGGVDSRNANTILEDVTITGNTVDVSSEGGFGSAFAAGGGIHATVGSLTLRDSRVSGNDVVGIGIGIDSATAVGGGIAVFPSTGLTVERSTVNDNTVTAVGGGNLAAGGGGLMNRGTTIVRDSTFAGNRSGDFGGPSPGGGGGISNNGDLTVVNSTISQNSADDFGGGIDSFGAGATTSLNGATIALNTGNADGNNFGDGGGTHSGEAPPAGITASNTLYVLNSVQTGSGTPTGPQCSGFQYVSGGYNLRSSADPSCTGFTGPGDLVNGGMHLGSLSDHGGPTSTHNLLAGSAAVNAGNPATPGSGGACPAIDQRGLYRGGSAGRCDIGAFELGATVSPPPGPPANPPIQVQPPQVKKLKKCKKKKAKKRAGITKKKKCKKKRK